MNTPALVLFVGNRDLQFHLSCLPSLPSSIASYLEPNNDEPSFLIPSKKNHNLSFFDISKILFEHYNSLAPFMHFPLLEKTLSFIQQHNSQALTNTHIYILSTHQLPQPDKQDTFHIGQILLRYLTDKKFNAELVEIYSNPTSIHDLFLFLHPLYSKIQLRFHPVFIEDAGSTPQMRIASQMAALFKNFHIFTPNARLDVLISENFSDIEKIILKEILNKMLLTYDYSGILKLPLNENILDVARKAQDCLNLNKIRISGYNYLNTTLNALNLLMENLRLNYIQERYTDCIGRIFRIEEATWQIFLYLFLSEKKLIDNPDVKSFKSGSFRNLFASNSVNNTFKLFLLHFPEIFVKKNNDIFFKSNPNKKLNSYGKNFTYFFFKHLNLYPDLVLFFEAINKRENKKPYSSSPLNELRNQSFMGHGFNGIDKNKFIDVLKKDLLVWLDELVQILKKYFPSFNYIPVFDNFNKKILEIYEKK